MEKRTPVTVGGKEYILVSEESEEYLTKIARYVDTKIIAYKRDLKISEFDAAVLTAMELADECQKATQQAENARSQIQNCLEDAAKARSEASELKRELAKYSKEK